jgi:hypothetical protein
MAIGKRKKRDGDNRLVHGSQVIPSNLNDRPECDGGYGASCAGIYDDTYEYQFPPCD